MGMVAMVAMVGMAEVLGSVTKPQLTGQPSLDGAVLAVKGDVGVCAVTAIRPLPTHRLHPQMSEKWFSMRLLTLDVMICN